MKHKQDEIVDIPEIKISKIELNHKILFPLFSIIITVIIMLIMALWVIPNSINAVKTGEKVGTETGILAGKVIGSFNGLTQGEKQGYLDGKIAGLNSKDTEIEIANAVKDTGVLQVLTANAKFTDFHQLGKTYAALYQFNGNIVFSVDLTKATISSTADDEIIITLPVPIAKINIDETSYNKLAEKQSKWFNGKADEGIIAALNTHTLIEEKSKEKVENYEYLEKAATDSARNHVEALAKNICKNKHNIIVSFKEDL